MSIWASAWAYEQDVQPSGRKFVLVALASFADEDGVCFPGQDTLATMTGQDARSIRRHLVELETAGILRRTHRYDKDQKKRTSDGYQILAPEDRLKPPAQSKRSKSPVTNRSDCPPDKLSADLLDHKEDPSVSNTPPTPQGERRTGTAYKNNHPTQSEQVEALAEPFVSEEFRNAWREFTQHRKEIRRKLTPTSIKRLFDKLACYVEPVAIAALHESVANGWTGIFPEKISANGNGKGNHLNGKPESRNKTNLKSNLEYLANLSRNGGQADSKGPALLTTSKLRD